MLRGPGPRRAARAVLPVRRLDRPDIAGRRHALRRYIRRLRGSPCRRRGCSPQSPCCVACAGRQTLASCRHPPQSQLPNFVPARTNSAPRRTLTVALPEPQARRSPLQPLPPQRLVADGCFREIGCYIPLGQFRSYRQRSSSYQQIGARTPIVMGKRCRRRWLRLTQHCRRLPKSSSWVFFFAAAQINGADAIKYTAGLVLLPLACVLLSRCSRQQHRWMNHRPLPRALGAASYSIYLW